MKITVLSLTIVIITIVLTNIFINLYASNFIYSSINTIPVNRTGLILGTSKYFKKGEFNRFYKHRIKAAVALYQSKKIKYIIASGDNSDKNYNEPRIMKLDLIRNGIPAESIYLDHAGFRTLDSIVRAQRVFRESKITIISQKFHNERAIFIARNFGIDAIAFNADDVPFNEGMKTEFREYFAKIKAIIDIYIINKQPKYLGDEIKIKQ